MRKDTLLELHEQLAVMMNYFKNLEQVDDDVFDAYDELDVTPDDIHMSKDEHRHAVFVLGESLATAMDEDEFSEVGRVGKRMQELAEETETDL